MQNMQVQINIQGPGFESWVMYCEALETWDGPEDPTRIYTDQRQGRGQGSRWQEWAQRW